MSRGLAAVRTALASLYRSAWLEFGAIAAEFLPKTAAHPDLATLS
jgi:hypothetical protein